MTKPRMQDHKRSFAEIRAMATRVQRQVTLCLAGDLNVRIEDLQKDLQTEIKRPQENLADESKAPEIQAEIDALKEQMAEKSATFVFRAISARKFSDLMDAHPGREGKDEAWNVETFPVALVAASLIDPALTEAEVGEIVDDVLNDGQWAQLFNTAWATNKSGVDLPPTLPGSRRLNASGTS